MTFDDITVGCREEWRTALLCPEQVDDWPILAEAIKNLSKRDLEIREELRGQDINQHCKRVLAPRVTDRDTLNMGLGTYEMEKRAFDCRKRQFVVFHLTSDIDFRTNGVARRRMDAKIVGDGQAVMFEPNTRRVRPIRRIRAAAVGHTRINIMSHHTLTP
ncbi:MAG: hypothetical protein HOP29_08315 [Phycisphaerales bacterium]|nr:hypothetical protein [Phycisphaerales bacterium]